MAQTKTEEKYPRVLIIGHPFNNQTGGGITMFNLFHDWPIENLALASTSNIRLNADFTICNNYYQLGYNGKLHPFPINIILPRIKCGPVEDFVPRKTADSQQLSGGKYKNFYRILLRMLVVTGIYNFLYKLKITDDFKKWIVEFNPDIIYSQLASLEMIRFVNDLQKLTKKSVAIHIMDDWLSAINKPSLLYFYWKKVFKTDFHELQMQSSVLMSIGEAMSEEYKIRYSREFIPFHNPIDINKWIPYSKKDWSSHDHFKILYAGRVGLGMKASIIDIARVVNSLSRRYSNLIFEIQTINESELTKTIDFNEHVICVKPVAYSKLPEKFAAADLLVLPVDFDERSIRFLKYSFQTKISEYMISGTPVLVYAPAVTATARYALKYGWAYVVTDRNDAELEKAITDLISDADLRKRLGEKGKQIAKENEDSQLVREKFRTCLLKGIEN
jgi:glycosyltransferase involved in cell wall biosynthesis